jgi:hypothetical protein
MNVTYRHRIGCSIVDQIDNFIHDINDSFWEWFVHSNLISLVIQARWCVRINTILQTKKQHRPLAVALMHN